MDGDSKREVLLITVSIFLFSLIIGLMGTVLPLYLRSQNFTIGEIGASFALASLLFAAGNVFLGGVSDYLGRKRFVLFAISGMIISSAILGLIPIFPILIAEVMVVISRLLSMLSSGLFYNFTNIRMADVAKKEKGFAYGLYMFGAGAGIGIGMIFFSFLLKFMPFNYLFYVGSVLAFVSLVFFSFTKDIAKKQEELRLKDLFRIKLSKPLKLALLTVFIMLFSFGIVDYFLIPIYLHDALNVPDSTVVLIIGISTLLYGIVSAFAGRFVDRKNEFRIAYIAMFAVAVTSVFLALYQAVVMFTIIWIIDYLFWSFGDPARFKINAELAGKEKGKILSLFGLVVAFGQAAGFAVAEKVVELFGYHGMFYLRGALFLIAALLTFWIQRIVKHEHNRAH